MTLRFRYYPARLGRPLYSLGGRSVRPRPIVDVAIVGPGSTRVRSALLDPAADATVFHESTAAAIGIDLAGAPVGHGTVATAGGIVALRYAHMMLRLTDGHERREWLAIVGFPPARLVYPMLGFAGCLQFFGAHFFGDVEEAELTINRLYPGT
jgi:hypothetical protein